MSCAIGAVLVLSSCQPVPQTPPPPAGAVTTLAPEAVGGIVEATIVGQGLTLEVRSEASVLAQAEGAAAQPFALCKRLRIHDPFVEDTSARSRFVEASRVSFAMAVEWAESDGGTRLTFAPTVIGTYNNSYVNMEFEKACSSSGRLERSIMEAVQP